MSIQSKRPGRPTTVESISSRIESIDKRLETESDPLAQLDLYQERIDVAERLRVLQATESAEAAEQGFVEVAGSYSDRKGISYSAWRQAGVPASVLKAAGISRTRRS